MNDSMNKRNKRLDSLLEEFNSIKKMAESASPAYGPLAKPLHPYIRGLLLSKLLIEEIRNELSKKYTVSWGQIANSDGEFSKEFDIIVFKKQPIHHWDVIDYSIIPHENVIALFECKTNIAGGTKKLYKELEEISRFSSEYYLLLEEHQASAKAFQRMRPKFVKKGFKDVYSLSLSYPEKYVWTYREPYYDDWNRFLDLIQKL